FCVFFFFQAEDGIRDKLVTGVQTCALPIYLAPIDARVHPGEPLAVFAGWEQSVPIGTDTESSSFIETGENRFDRRPQFLRVTIVGERWVFLRREKIIIDRYDVPKRGIDRIEFRLFAGIGKAIRQHALRNSARPGEQNIARVFQMSGRDAEAANGDKRVAAPIAEPGVAGDEGFAFAALDEICVRRAFEWTGEIF